MATFSDNECLERSTWDTFWVPEDVSVVNRPEILALRSERPIEYLNCVYRHRITPRYNAKIVEEVKAFHGTISRWHICDVVDATLLEKELSRVGYQLENQYDACTVHASTFVPKTVTSHIVKRVDCIGTLKDWWQASERAFSKNTTRSESEMKEDLALCRDANAQSHRFVVYQQERPVSSGGISIFQDLCFGFLWAGGTIPEERGKGAYSALVSARIKYAKQLGIKRVGLYARENSSSPIVRAQGFDICGHMNQWQL